jgi:GABA(A) receptor-associated protein
MYPPNKKHFIDEFSFFERSTEASRIMKKYVDRIPIICEKNPKDNGIFNLDKHKYLVPLDITIGQFMYVIRKRMHLHAGDAIFLFVGDKHTIVPINTAMDQVYSLFKNLDGFLYIIYSKENVFG